MKTNKNWAVIYRDTILFPDEVAGDLDTEACARRLARREKNRHPSKTKPIIAQLAEPESIYFLKK